VRSPKSCKRFSRVVAYRARRLSFANVVSAMALFVALGGSSYAAIKIGSAEIADNSVRGRDIHKSTVRGTDIRDGDLTGKDIRNSTIAGAG
jgi:hypothetical protein